MSDQPEVSKVQLYVDQKAWNWRLAGSNQLNIETCPLPDCGRTDWKFFINSENGCWDCKACQEKGNLYSLMQRMGDRMENLSSMQDLARSKQSPESLPDIEALHAALHADDDIVPFLADERGWEPETVNQLKLGLDTFGDKKWLVYPYFHKGQLVYAKWRSLPPAAKDFRGITGRDNPLYNEDAIVKDMEELFFVEGEADAISLINKGIANVVGVPGAGTKKAAWIVKVDNANAKAHYLIFDNDRAGQDGARSFATRFGIEKFRNIALPPFKKADGSEGKDLTEWFKAGHTVEELRVLAQAAHAFDVPGVQSVGDLLDGLRKQITEKGTLTPDYPSPWAPLNAKFGGANRGQVIGIEAEAKVGKTTMVAQWVWWLCHSKGEVGLIDCLEMANHEMAKKFVSHVAQVDLSPYSGTEQPEKVEYEKRQAEEFLVGIDTTVDVVAGSKGDLLFAHKIPESVDEAFDTIRNAVRRYGCSIVAFDNLQNLADITLKNAGHRTAHISMISKRFVALAKELNILIFLIIQPKRVAEGEIVSARHSEGSSAIEKDVDAMICLHRQREGKVKQSDLEYIGNLDVATNFSPKLYVRVDLSRYAPGGTCTLWMDGGRSTISEMPVDPKLNHLPVATEVGSSSNMSVPTEAEPELVEA